MTENTHGPGERAQRAEATDRSSMETKVLSCTCPYCGKFVELTILAVPRNYPNADDWTSKTIRAAPTHKTPANDKCIKGSEPNADLEIIWLAVDDKWVAQSVSFKNY